MRPWEWPDIPGIEQSYSKILYFFISIAISLLVGHILSKPYLGICNSLCIRNPRHRTVILVVLFLFLTIWSFILNSASDYPENAVTIFYIIFSTLAVIAILMLLSSLKKIPALNTYLNTADGVVGAIGWLSLIALISYSIWKGLKDLLDIDKALAILVFILAYLAFTAICAREFNKIFKHIYTKHIFIISAYILSLYLIRNLGWNEDLKIFAEIFLTLLTILLLFSVDLLSAVLFKILNILFKNGVILLILFLIMLVPSISIQLSGEAWQNYKNGFNNEMDGQLIEANACYSNAKNLAVASALLCPANSRAFSGIGAACYGLGDLTMALQHFNISFLFSRSPIVKFNKGLVYYKMGNYEAAMKEYSSYLEEDPNNLKVLFQLGLSLEANKNKSKSIKIFAQISKDLKAPRDATEYYNLAYSLEAIERHDDALDAINKSLEYDPEYIDALELKKQILGELAKYPYM